MICAATPSLLVTPFGYIALQKLGGGPYESIHIADKLFEPDYDVPYKSSENKEQYVIFSSDKSMISRLSYPEEITQDGVVYSRRVSPSVLINGSGFPQLEMSYYAGAHIYDYKPDFDVPYLNQSDKTVWVLYSKDQSIPAKLMYPFVIRVGSRVFVRMDSWV